MAALVAVMIMVSIGTFSWESIRNLRTHPKSSSVVMVATVIVVVVTYGLAKGVFVSVLLSALFFATKVSRLFQVSSKLMDEGKHRNYLVSGEVFFASEDRFISAFDFKEAVDCITIDVSRAHFWDITAINALDKTVMKFRRDATAVDIIGMNEASTTLVDRYAVHDKAGATRDLTAHSGEH